MKSLLAILALTLISIGCTEPPKSTPPPSAGALLEVRGAVSLTRGEGPPRPAALQPLFTGDLLSTGPNSSAVLRSGEGATVELGEETRFRVGQRQGRVLLELQAGAISVLGGEMGESGLPVVSAFGTTRLSRGGKASLAIDSAGLSVSVALGSITVEAEDGGRQVAVAGQRLIVKLGSIEIVEDVSVKPVEVSLPPIQFVLSREAGRPMLKKKGEARFSAVPDDPTPVADGTAFQLPVGARARLSTKGVLVSLSSGAAGQLGQSAVLAGGRRVELHLASGSASTLFDGSAPTTLVVTGAKKQLQVLSKVEAAVALVQTGAGPKLEVQAGEVEVVADGQTATVKAGERADLTGARLVLAPRPRPSLVLPVDRTVRVFAVKLGEVGLSAPVEGAARVQVATEASFAGLLVSGAVVDPLVVVPAPPSGELYWRVLDAAGGQLHQGHARFALDHDRAQAVENPKSEVAETGLKAVVYFQSELPALTFTFPAREEAKRYRLRIYRASELGRPLVEREVSGTRCTVEAGPLVEGSYVWYAAPLDEKGNEKAGGRMNKLDIQYDNTLTSLAITAPRLDTRGDSTAAGVAPLGARLFVNGKPVTLGPEGRFEVPLAGAQLAIFRLVGRGGDESYWVRRAGP